MRRHVVLSLVVIAAIAWSGCQSPTESQVAINAPEVEGQIDELIRRMTLEEKVGQMTQVTLEVIKGEDKDGWVELSEKKLKEAIVKYRVGSILNCGGQARSVTNWHKIISQIQDMATRETRLGIPIIYGIDSIHGANYILDATLFPQNIAMAATGNVDLVRESAEITALETRAAGIPWNFNPVLGLARQPWWARFYETFGEDPYIVSVMGSEYIKAQQGNDLSDPTKVAACMKHYLGYSVPYSGMDRTPAYIPERQLRQYFLKPFAAGAQAQVATVMVNSSEINGIPVHSDRRLLTDVLRGELGFEGFVVSDWYDIKNLYEREKVATSEREATRMAVLAGIDMSMVPLDYSFFEHLVDLVKTGEVPMSRIDEAVRRILVVKQALGLFENPYPNKKLTEQFASKTSQQTNHQAASEAVTLLKNSNEMLPLAKDAKVLVTGPCANKLSVLNGGWTITWQGDREELYPEEHLTILEAIQEKVGKDDVEFIQGVDFDKPIDIQKAVEQAKQADMVIACLGEPTYCETPGNIDDLNLSRPQIGLIKQLVKADKPIVLVLTEGRPRVIREIVDDMQAIVMGYLPGMEGGQAIADVLFGDVNPSGKLPFTYPRYSGWYTWYDHKPSEAHSPNKIDPQWPFGYGLSYTSYAYAGLRLDKQRLSRGDSLTVRVDVKNTGKRKGKEIVHLYLSDLAASVTPPVKVLKGFRKVAPEAGETQTVRFELTWDDFAFIGRDNKPIVEPGEFTIRIADLTETFVVESRSSQVNP
jgi:beta-glucosidase